jgi:hypothetical protein
MLRIKNWSKFQHFKDRRPPWVKLYRELLDDIEWHQLDPKAAKVLVMLWLIASEDSGNLPETKQLAFRLRMSERETKSVLSSLSHWMEQPDINVISERYQGVPVADTPNSATVEFGVGETETETETETYKQETEKKKHTRVPRFDAQAHLISIGVDEQIACDWIAHRKAKRATPTLTAIDGIQQEAQKASITLGKALSISCQRGWIGFEAAWIEKTNGVNGHKSERQIVQDAQTRAIFGDSFSVGEKLITGEIVQ